MVFFPIFVTFSSMLALCTGEIIKLENKTHILCVTDNSEEMISVMPPVVAESRDDSVFIENAEIWTSDWALKNSKDVIVPMVVDKRWENFETINTKDIYSPSVANFAFSVASNSVNVTLSDPVLTTKKSKQGRNIIDWQHYAVHPTDINSGITFQINATVAENSYWKIHDYNVRWAESSSETETVVPISSDEVSCVVVYMYLCSHCILDIRVGTSQFMLQGSGVEKWVSQRFSLLSAASMTITRSTAQTDITIGQWAIDIRQCPSTKSSKTIYEVSLVNDVESGTTRTCTIQTLVQRENTNIFNCSSGLLGRACDINCEELLNSDLKYCQGHQICDDTLTTSECLCAWGYQGSSCDGVCTDGNWGLSCQNTCNNCDRCDGQIGECKSSASGLGKGLGLIVFGIIWAGLT